MRTSAGLSSSNTSTSNTPRWTHLVSSPLSRCREFAEITATACALEAAVEDQWQEIDYGDWDGMEVSKWRELARDQFKAFRDDPAKLVPPNGEAFLDFQARILNAWQSLHALPDNSHMLLVTHGGVMRVILPEVLGMPVNRSYPLHIPFACMTRVKLEVGRQKSSASLVFHNRAEFD